jgi:hypothetical protein
MIDHSNILGTFINNIEDESNVHTLIITKDLKQKHYCLNSDFHYTYKTSVWTMLNDNPAYIEKALKLGRTLKKYTTDTEFDLVVMTLKSKPLSKESNEKLAEVGFVNCEVESIRPPHLEGRMRVDLQDKFGVLRVFAMTVYDRVLFLDADTIVDGPIDDLLRMDLQGKTIGVTKDIRNRKWVGTFNSGVMLLHPSQETYSHLMKLIMDEHFIFDYIMSVQGFFNAVYKDDWNELPQNNKITGVHMDPTTIWCPHCKLYLTMECVKAKNYIMRKYGFNESYAEERVIEKGTGTKGSKCLQRVVHLQPKHTINHQINDNNLDTTFTIDPLRGQVGQWIKDPEFALQNSFLERVQARDFGLNDTDEAALFANSTLWKWEDSNSPVTTISRSGFCQVCYHLNVTRVMIIGDSLSAQFRVALEGLLGYPPTQKQADQLFRWIVHKEFNIPCRDVHGIPHHFDHVTTFFHRINGMSHLTPLSTTPTPPFIESNPYNTVVVFNIGAHLVNVEEYKEGFDKILAWLQSFNVTSSNSKIIPFFRETLPAHPSCEPFQFRGDIKLEILQADKTEPYKDYDSYLHSTQEMLKRELSKGNETDWQWFDFKHANGTVEQYNAYSKDIIDNIPSDKLQVHWLNVYNSTILRRDGHRIFGPGSWDCLHYLHPGPIENWVHLFYSALLDLAGLEEV